MSQSKRTSYDLSILMPGIETRNWRPLWEHIRKQVHAYGDRVEFQCMMDNGELSSGNKRNILTRNSSGRYIAFVDDDDWVADNYVESLLQGIDYNPDVVTFCLGYYKQSHTFRGPVWRQTEKWEFGVQANDRKRGKMAVNHLCAWKRDIATRVAWCPQLGYYDDNMWFQPLLGAELVKEEVHLDRQLYEYRFDWGTTVNQQKDRRLAAKEYVGSGIRCFYGPSPRFANPNTGIVDKRFHNEILIEVGGARRFHNREVTRVRDNINLEFDCPNYMLRLFHTIKLNVRV